MAEWTNETVLFFLECYKNEPIIWNSNHEHYKDRRRVYEAWSRISQTTDIAIPELKKKRDCLMATYRFHLRKKKACIKNGEKESEIRTPTWFAYESMESFLHEVYTNRSNAENTLSQEISIIEDGVGPNSPILLSVLDTSCKTEKSSSSGYTPASYKRRGRPLERSQPDLKVNEMFKSQNEGSKPQKEEDECDLFAKLLVKKLRRLPVEDREAVMYDIDGVFIKRHERLSMSKHNTVQSYSSNSPPDVHKVLEANLVAEDHSYLEPSVVIMNS